MAERLPEPIFRPSTAAENREDQSVSLDEAVGLLARAGLRLKPSAMNEAGEGSLAVYADTAGPAEARAIILADTKLGLGLWNGEQTSVDEMLTPGSPRFWPGNQLRVGENPRSCHKQFLRDYLEILSWKGCSLAPTIPEKIIAQTCALFRGLPRPHG